MNLTAILFLLGILALALLAWAMAALRAARRRSAERERDRLFELSPDLIFMLDARGCFRRVSPAARESMAFEPQSLLGRPFTDLVHPEDREAARAAFEVLMTGKLLKDFQLRILRGDGQVVWLSWSAAMEDALIYVIARDITLRRRAEEAMRDSEARLRESEERLRAIFEAVVDAVIIIDPSGRIESVNSAAERIFGWRSSEMIGRDVSMLMPPPDRDLHHRYLANYMAGRQPRIMGRNREAVGVTRDGREFPIDLTVSEVRVGGHRLFTGVIRDATERKRVSRMKSDFVATVSHELRTPLTAIRGSLGLVAGGLAGPLPDKAAELISIAHKNSERLVLLVNDILDMEKIESGSMEFRLQEMDLVRLVEQAVEANHPYAEQFGAAIALKLDVDMAPVQADPDRLMQVLGNLLSNACKFSPRGGLVELRLRREGKAARIEVADQGPGIPEDFRPRMFERFAQADTSDARKRGGTGLGLSICKAIVERLGGEIGFSCPPQGGTVFHVRLPLVRPD